MILNSLYEGFVLMKLKVFFVCLLDRTNELVQKWGKDEWKTGKPRGHFTGTIF